MKVYTYFNKQRKSDDGMIPIYVIVYRKGMPRIYINTGMNSSLVFYDGVFPLTERNHKAKTKRLMNIIDEIERVALENSLLPNHELKAKIMIEVFDVLVNEKYLWEHINAHASLQKNKNTKSNYSVLANVVKEYDDKATLRIDINWIERFFKHLVETRSENTAYKYVSDLRSVINFHRKRNGLKNDAFMNFSFRYIPTKNRDLTLEQLRTIMNLDVIGNRAMYRDAFMLSFYLIGVNPVDIYNASKDQVKDGRFIYHRSKTKKEYSILIPKEAQEIIDRYSGKEKLLCFCEKDNYRNFSHKINYFLDKTIKGTTLYYARHTWATIAYSIDIPLDTISDALGHSHGAKVTGIYIRKDIKKIDVANRKVIDLVIGANPTETNQEDSEG